MQRYNVVLETKDGEIHTVGCECSSKYEASTEALKTVASDKKTKKKGYAVTDIKMEQPEHTVKYVNTNSLSDIINGDKDEE